MGVKDTKSFIERSRQVHGDKYSYEKVVYVRSSVPVIITCPIHGDFKRTSGTHCSMGYGCPRCGFQQSPKQTQTDETLENVKQKYNDAISSAIKEKSFLYYLKYPQTDIIIITIRKSPHTTWNLFILPHEIQSAIEFINHGKIDPRIWTSITPTLSNRWSHSAINKMLDYTETLPEFVELMAKTKITADVKIEDFREEVF